MKKLVVTICYIILFIIFLTNSTYGVSVDGITENPTSSTPIDSSVTDIINNVLGVVSVAGVAVAFGMLVFVGIKWVSAAPSERAEIKKNSIIFIIGAVCILGAVMIMTVLSEFAEELLAVVQ